jgi:recombination protein RecT
MTTQTNDKTPKESARESMQKSLAKSKGSGTMKALNSDDFSAIFNFYKPQIAQALPKHLTPERIIQQAITIVSRVPELKECTPQSFIGAIMQASILGFQPVNALGQCYFIPYNNKKIERKEVQFQIGYRGMLDLARRSGEIQTIYAQVVYANDEFSFEFGLNPVLKHVPAPGERGVFKYVYAVVKFNNGGYAFDVMSKADVEKIRKRSQSQQQYINGKAVPSEKPIGIWASDYDPMAKKTVLRRVLNYCPLSVDVLSKVQSDGGTIKPEDFHSGSGDLNLDGISFADFDTVTEESEPPEEKPDTQTETEQLPTEQPKSGLFPEGSKK